MNCECPTLAVQRGGVNPATLTGFKPFLFLPWRQFQANLKEEYNLTAAKFVAKYFNLQREHAGLHETWSLFWQDEFDGSSKSHIVRSLQPNNILVLPCGKCALCRRANRKMWALRAIHEAQVCNGGVFLTLTVSDDSLSKTFPGGSLCYKPFQAFMKRLRKGVDGYKMNFVGLREQVRFLMCGEYGETHGRPHYHALLFGVDFPEKFVQRYSAAGEPLYDSPFLQRLRFVDGQEVFGPVSNFAPITPYDASYVAGYVEKKLSPRQLKLRHLAPEFVNMSRRPGIGYEWIRRNHGDVWRFLNDECIDDSVYQNGFYHLPPRYYFSRSKIDGLLSDDECDMIKARRGSRATESSRDSESFLESLKQAHAKAVRVEKSKSQVPRQF